jgi:hypothetical protein
MMRVARFEGWGLPALALGAGFAASGAWSAAEEGSRLPSHARALSLVIEQNFREPGGITQDAEERVDARPTSVRAWRVRAVEGRDDRFDVIFYIGDRPACVWRVTLPVRKVIPDGCSLELWEDSRA